MLNMEELRGLDVDELRERADKLRKELMQYRFQAKTGKLERDSLLRQTRRDIARIMTAISEKKNKEGAKA